MKHYFGFVSNYYFDTVNGRIILYFNDRTNIVVYLDENSGRIVKRMKINTATGVWHPGVRIGMTVDNFEIIAHNHFQVGRPSIATRAQYTQRQVMYWDDNRTCNQTRMDTIKSALEQIKIGKAYHFWDYNCQTFVNIACTRKAKSESVENAKAGLGVAASVLLVFSLIGLAASSK